MSQRHAIRMTDDEVESFLASESRCRVATIDGRGRPRVVPVEYVVFQDRLTFWADPESQKVVNLRRNPGVACVIDTGANFGELRGLELVGDASIVDDLDTSREVAELFVERLPTEWQEVARSQLHELASERVAIIITPTKTISWDHSKVPGLTPADIGR